jgi:ATP-binding cassette subfamily B protein
MDVLIPLLMSKLIDDGIDAGNMSVIGKIGLWLVIATLCSLTFGVLSGWAAANASAGFAKNLRHDLFYAVQDYSFSNIDKFSTASIVTRLTTDVTNIQNAYQMIIRIAVRSPVMLILSLTIAFSVNHRLSLIFLIAIPILGIGLGLIMTHAHPIFERVFRIYDNLNRVVQENLYGIRVVKSFVREDHEVKKFSAVSEDIYRNFTRAEKLLAFNSPLMQFCSYGCMLLTSWIGARMIVGGTMTTGQLMSIITYSMQILMSLMMLSMVFVMITISRASAERIDELLTEKSDLVSPKDAVHTVADGSVVFDHVNFSYANRNDKLCLTDICLDIQSGETVGIIGGTGSSKSSLVQLIPRLYDATEGSVLVGGVDVRRYDLDTLRDSVAMVLQKNVLFSGTIKENLRWGNPDATDEDLVRVCRLAQADSFIREFPDGYDTYLEQGGTNVSGGQKQRLCIARALLKKPAILILDDSTSAVDTRTDALIRKAFREEIPNTTKFIIAQRISSVQDADKIIVLNDGRIDAVGTHEQLLASNAIYREVYESQQKGGMSDAAE